MSKQVLSQPPKMVHLRVPATTANLGPAYDTLGMAISIFLDLKVEVAESFGVTYSGEGAQHVSLSEDNMLVMACMQAFKMADKPMPPLHFTIRNDIPYGCGCGSSSAAAVGGFVAGMILSGLTLPTRPQEVLLDIIARIESHPDNAAPAIYGGVQMSYTRDTDVTSVKLQALAVQEGGDDQGSSNTHRSGPHDAEGALFGPHYHTLRVPTPSSLSLVMFIPHRLMKASTHVTRDLVPRKVELSKAIHNISRTAMLVLSFTTDNLSLLRNSTDCLHEIYRADALYPHYYACSRAAREVGAVHVFLSGAGPAVCAFVSGRHGEMQLQSPEERVAEKVAHAMVAAAAEVGVAGRAIITRASELGVHLVGSSEMAEGVQYVNI